MNKKNLNINLKIDSNKSKIPVPELIVIVLYVVFYTIVTIFHEPWFDESEAWQIARCASIKDILFVIPHYEGHPVLWYFILMLPARLGFPYEISLKAIGGIIMLATVAILELKCPIKRWIKWFLPFTYFFFYQYGISVRPYGVMLLFIILAAITFEKRDAKPFRFVLCLVGLCLSSAIGIVIAGGIAFAWLIDIIKEDSLAVFFRKLIKSRRSLSLIMLLAIAVALIIQIIPADDTYATSLEAGNSVLLRLVCSLFAFIPDSILTENEWSICENNLQGVSFSPIALAGTALLGLFIWGIIFVFSNRIQFKYFAIPYSFFAIFAAVVYFTAHHIGVVLYILLFWAWINCYKVDDSPTRIKAFIDNNKGKFAAFMRQNAKSIKFLCNAVIALLLLLSIYWSGMSSVLEMKVQFSYGRQAAKFIKEHNLDSLKVFTTWQNKDKDGDGIYEVDTNCMYSQVNLYPYFDTQFIANATYAYTTHRVASEAENNANLEAWKSYGVPDVLIGYVDVMELTDGEYDLTHYSPVFKLDMRFIWRGSDYVGYDYIFVRNDLLETYGLDSLYDQIETVD